MTGTNYTGSGHVGTVVKHAYLSTACLHDIHGHCQSRTTLEGEEKVPATCKWCATPCICSCHAEQSPGEQQVYERLEVLVDQALAQYEQGLVVNVKDEMRQIARELTC